MSSSSEAESELQDRIRQQEVVANLGQQALEGDDLDQLMHDASAAVAETLDTEYCKVLEVLPGGDEVLLREGVGWHDGLVGNATVSTDLDSQAGYTLVSEAPISVDDLRTESRFSGPDLLIDHGVISGISVSIGSVEDPWGVLGTHTTEQREFTEHDATFVKNVANILAEAIENEETKQKLREEIVERENRERELARFKRAVEASGHAIYMTDTDGQITYVNSAFEEITGYSVDEAIGRTPHILQSGEHDEEYYRKLWQTVLAGEVWEEEIVDRRKCGDRYFAEQTIAPVTDENGELDRFIAVHTDVTERKERERALEASNERLEQFAYAASHDLQEPLRMVSSYLTLIERRYGDVLDKDGQEFLEFAVNGADRMREMIEGLLQYSRIEMEGKPLKPVDLNEILEDAKEDLKIQIEETNAEITAETLPRVEGDAGQLRQVFQNLLSNAIEYSGDESPRIDVSAERERDEWIISVRDGGIGIDPASTDRIFEVFQRLHTHEEHPGTGIGLALCERIVERHGGEIWVDSEPGEGSTFSFRLPTIQEPAAADGSAHM
ncbi:ATP-binding protein [Natrialbaceae archaeon GCM10025810]|uniref:GAF domain-containing sensor histidine kinase n=1 Tax=Halovalidus salilacus TaxID=3075124 RepID=UPI0036116CAD